MITTFNWTQEIYGLIYDIDAILESKYDSESNTHNLSEDELAILIKFIGDYYLEIETRHELFENMDEISGEISPIQVDFNTLESLEGTARLEFIYFKLLPGLNLKSIADCVKLYNLITNNYVEMTRYDDCRNYFREIM